jgi:hypothetical protein
MSRVDFSRRAQNASLKVSRWCGSVSRRKSASSSGWMIGATYSVSHLRSSSGRAARRSFFDGSFAGTAGAAGAGDCAGDGGVWTVEAGTTSVFATEAPAPGSRMDPTRNRKIAAFFIRVPILTLGSRDQFLNQSFTIDT